MLRELIRELRESGRCVLFSSHVMQEVAALCDDIVIISHGRVVVRGTPAQILRSDGERRIWKKPSYAPPMKPAPARWRHERRSGRYSAKRCVENLRDRRVILSAFFFGVLLAPVIFGLTTTMVSKRAVANQDKPLKLPIAAAATRRTWCSSCARTECRSKMCSSRRTKRCDAVRSGERDLVLLIGDEYGKALQAGESAPLSLVVDTANSNTSPSAERARQLLECVWSSAGGVATDGSRDQSGGDRSDRCAHPGRRHSRGPFAAHPRHDDVLSVSCRCWWAASISPSTPPRASANVIRWSRC